MILKKINFLVVDDEEYYIKLVKDYLRELDFSGEVFESYDGLDAFNALNRLEETEKKVDFIISDIIMPKVSGIELLKLVRDDQRFINLPFLIMSTQSEKELVLSAIKHNVSNYIVKPFEPNDLKEKLDFCWLKHI